MTKNLILKLLETQFELNENITANRFLWGH